ncbi:MAG: HAD family hydrolase [Prevotellaceae bacterium]|jgi:phosphoglycolate phosphatase|nr:HAD family hydrolase [Prevotellaceae bacterium]
MRGNKMVKLVAFDLDGTIGETISMCIQAFVKAVSPYTDRRISEEEIVRTFGLNEEGMIKAIAGERWRAALADFYAHYRAMHGMCASPFDGIRELIGALKARNVLVALVTGKGKESCEITLEQFGMQSYFDCIETGSPEKNRKAEAFIHLLQKYNLQPDELVYVGDAVSDVSSCREAGIRCLSAAWASSTDASRLEECNKGCVFLTVKAVEEHIMQLVYSALSA